MPDWREPFPDLPLPPKQVRLGAARGVVHREHARGDALAEAERRLRVVRVDRRGQPVAVAVRQLHRLVEVGERGDADDGPERLCRVDLVVPPHTVHDRRVAVDAGVGVADEAVARGLSLVIRPVPVEPEGRVVVADQAEPVLEALREAPRGSSGRRARPESGPRLARPRPPSSNAAGTRRAPTRARSPCPARCSAARPSEAAEERALHGEVELGVGITTSRFLPPSSRQADWPWRPVSSPMREPTADEPVKPTLSTSPSSSARSRPSKAVGPSAWTG